MVLESLDLEIGSAPGPDDLIYLEPILLEDILLGRRVYLQTMITFSESRS